MSEEDARRVLTNSRLWKWLQDNEVDDEKLIDIRDRLNSGEILTPSETFMAQVRIFKALDDGWGKGMEFLRYMLGPQDALDEWRKVAV